MVALPARGEIWWAAAEDQRRHVLVVTRTEAVAVLTGIVVAPVTRTVRNIPPRYTSARIVSTLIVPLRLTTSSGFGVAVGTCRTDRQSGPSPKRRSARRYVHWQIAKSYSCRRPKGPDFRFPLSANTTLRRPAATIRRTLGDTAAAGSLEPDAIDVCARSPRLRQRKALTPVSGRIWR